MAIEPIDVIEAFKLNYNVGSALAYIMRHGRKGDPVSDLKKAMNFLHREIYGTWYVEHPRIERVLDAEGNPIVVGVSPAGAGYFAGSK